MKRTVSSRVAITGLFIFSMLLAAFPAAGQGICNPGGNLMIFTNYDGGHLNIVVNQNIPNLKIGICSYEACSVTLSGAFVGNVTEVRYAGYNSPNNNSCVGGNIPTTAIAGAGTASTSIVFAPSSPIPNNNGYGSIICGYSCDNNSNQGGCNTVDQIEAYFLGYFSGSTLFAHRVQYGCWSGTQSVTAGGDCCPIPPLLPGGISGTQTLCAGQTPAALQSATAASGGAGTITYTWQSSTVSQISGFSNVSSANNASFQPAALGVTTWYRRAVSTPSNAMVYSNVIAVTVYPLPALNISSNAPVCEGESLLVNASGGSQSYAWTGPGQFVSSGPGFSLVAQPSSAGVYSLVVQGAMGCQNSGSVNVVVNLAPVVIASASPTLLCSGETATLTASGAVSYQWLPGVFPGSAVPVTPSVSAVYTVSGIDQNNCGAAASVTITVQPKLSPNAQASDSVLCSGKQVTLTAGGSPSLVWMPGSLNGMTVTVSPITSVVYTVQSSDPADCMHDGLVSLTVNPTPSVTFVAQPTLICTGESATISASSGDLLEWLPPFTAPGFTVQVIPLSTTSYSVKAVSANSCENVSGVTVKVDPCLGVAQNGIPLKAISIIPNPSPGTFLITAPNAMQVAIFDVAGAEVRSADLTPQNGFSVSIKDLPPGIYLIRSADGRLVGKASVVR